MKPGRVLIELADQRTHVGRVEGGPGQGVKVSDDSDIVRVALETPGIGGAFTDREYERPDCRALSRAERIKAAAHCGAAQASEYQPGDGRESTDS